MISRREFSLGAAVSLGCLGTTLSAATFADISLPPSPALPDPLVFHDGRRVTDSRTWRRRRTEILATATAQMYGQSPQANKLRIKVLESGSAFQGKAIRRQVRLYFLGEDGPFADLLIYRPAKIKRAATLLALNFWGNQSVTSDPAVVLPQSWIESAKNTFIDLSCVQNHRVTAACRGIDARRWPVEDILDYGLAFATMYRGDIDPDLADGSVRGLRSFYPDLAHRSDNFSAIAAWAWSLSRAMDYIESDDDLDAKQVAIFGWSRLGKAAIWAGANDERFAAVISHESGAGGAKLFRRGVGEDIRRLNTVFPHWYCQNFRAYNGMDRQLPFDQHLVLASIAPRPIYIGSAQDDHLSDPDGEFLSGVLASPVYRLLGTSGLSSSTMPPLEHPLLGSISYHIRPGAHDVLPYDWAQYLQFLTRCFHLQIDPSTIRQEGR